MPTKSFAEDKSRPPYLKAIHDTPDPAPTENELFEAESEENPLASFINQADANPQESKEKPPPKETENPFLPSFLTDLIHSVKNTLVSIKSVSSLSMDKFNDSEFRKYAQKSINEDIKKIDTVLNSLLNYIHINTPIIKSNTVSIILEEVLEANEKQIKNKNIKIIKKCEKDLPETFIHDEQVRFILHSILQYALLSTPQNGTIGFLIKPFDFQCGGSDKKTIFERNGYIEAAIGFIGKKEGSEPPKEHPVRSEAQEEDTAKLILQLVKEILQKNHGSMTYEADPKKPRTLMTVKFPIERRKVVYYEPISI
jgi:two-component sensor histidine kinase